MVLSIRGKNHKDGRFNWSDSFFDAVIMSGLAFFSTLGALGVTGLLHNPEGWLAAFIAGATQFFLTLAVKRGLREKER